MLTLEEYKKIVKVRRIRKQKNKSEKLAKAIKVYEMWLGNFWLPELHQEFLQISRLDEE